jgi:hypothetical protein
MGAVCYQFIEIKKIRNENFLVSKRKNKNLFFIFIKKLFFYKIKFKIYIFCWRKKNFPEKFNFRERGGMLCPRRRKWWFWAVKAMVGYVFDDDV